MTDILNGLSEALRLILSLDRGLWEIIILSLQVTGAALLISAAIGVPLGAGLGLWRVPARRLITALLYTGMGLPPVVVGLFVYLFLSRSGPLGGLGWLFKPAGMVGG